MNPHAVVILIACLAPLAGASCNRGHQGPMPEAETRTYRACTSDADCVYTHNGCCDCVNGGQDLAVNRAQHDAFRAKFACAAVGCTEMAGDCGQGRVSCEQNVCTYHRPSNP